MLLVCVCSSVGDQLSTSQQPSITWKEYITLTSSFYQLIAHSLNSLETNIYLYDVIRFSVTYKSVQNVGNKLPNMLEWLKSDNYC